MSNNHPEMMVGDTLLLRANLTGRPNPFLGSVIVTGYDGARHVVFWQAQGNPDHRGFGPAERFCRVPFGGWEDPPARPLRAARAAECAHDGKVPQQELEAAWRADISPQRRAALIGHYHAMITWAEGFLSRLDAELAADEIRHCRLVLAELETARAA